MWQYVVDLIVAFHWKSWHLGYGVKISKNKSFPFGKHKILFVYPKIKNTLIN